MYLTRSGSASYYCAELTELQTILDRNGYQQVSATSQYEASRWRKARSVIVIYYNGTVLLQGADTESPRSLFAAYIPDQATLPF